MTRKTLPALCAAVLLSSCSLGSNWHLVDSGYTIDALNDSEFAFEVHVNQLTQLGGDIKTPAFHQFVAERLKWHRVCAADWALMPCAEDGSCIQRTRRSVTVPGRCVVS